MEMPVDRARPADALMQQACHARSTIRELQYIPLLFQRQSVADWSFRNRMRFRPYRVAECAVCTWLASTCAALGYNRGGRDRGPLHCGWRVDDFELVFQSVNGNGRQART